MSAVADNLIVDAITQALGGIVNHHCADARAAGKTSVRVKIPLADIHARMKSRLDGMHGHVDPAVDDETFEELCELGEEIDGPIPDEMYEAIESLQVPTVEELRTAWLPKIIAAWPNAVLTADALELDIEVPPPRKAHAR